MNCSRLTFVDPQEAIENVEVSRLNSESIDHLRDGVHVPAIGHQQWFLCRPEPAAGLCIDNVLPDLRLVLSQAGRW